MHKRYKFGVLLIKEGQTKEEEWFANEHDCPAFEEFLNIIGKKIKLKGYNGWAAGLDRKGKLQDTQFDYNLFINKGGDSGEYTYTNTWYEHVLAYHVSSLIPSRPGDKQQVQRKRHIGNGNYITYRKRTLNSCPFRYCLHHLRRRQSTV